MWWQRGDEPMEHFFKRFGKLPPDSLSERYCLDCRKVALWHRVRAHSACATTYGCPECGRKKTVKLPPVIENLDPVTDCHRLTELESIS